jgi:hypothetical protein
VIASMKRSRVLELAGRFRGRRAGRRRPPAPGTWVVPLPLPRAIAVIRCSCPLCRDHAVSSLAQARCLARRAPCWTCSRRRTYRSSFGAYRAAYRLRYNAPPQARGAIKPTPTPCAIRLPVWQNHRRLGRGNSQLYTPRRRSCIRNSLAGRSVPAASLLSSGGQAELDLCNGTCLIEARSAVSGPGESKSNDNTS